MPLLLLAIFLAVPLIEVFLFIELGSVIGALWTVLLCIATAVTGAALVRWQGRAVMASAQQALRENRMPAVEVFDGVCIMVAGCDVADARDSSPMRWALPCSFLLCATCCGVIWRVM